MADQHKRSGRGLYLLASTSVVALALTALPVTVEFQPEATSFAFQAKDAWAKSCFLAGTLIRMADGSLLPIEKVAVGDYVRTPGGGGNRVTGVERPDLGWRRLYGFNGGLAFFTAEHPFMTLGGWKAIDPAATALETTSLKVARLCTGDVLLTEPASGAVLAEAVGAESHQPILSSIRLVSIESTAADPETQLYNLLLDGDHRYFANGFLVHNKGEGGEGGGGGEGGEGGESGESGESGSSDSGEWGESGSSGTSNSGAERGIFQPSIGGGFGEVEQKGRDLTLEEEAEAISNGWQ